MAKLTGARPDSRSVLDIEAADRVAVDVVLINPGVLGIGVLGRPRIREQIAAHVRREVPEDVELFLHVEYLVPERAEESAAQIPVSAADPKIQRRREVRMRASDDRAVGKRYCSVAVHVPELDSSRSSAALYGVRSNIGSVPEQAVSLVAVERANGLADLVDDLVSEPRGYRAIEEVLL